MKIIKNMKNCIYENGVYIYAKGVLHTPDAYKGPGKVVVVFGSEAFEISPKQIDDATWDQAMAFAQEKGGNLPNRLQRLIMREYHKKIQEALKNTGGSPLSEDGLEWLCEKYNSSSSWFYYGNYGFMNHYLNCYNFSGRPLLAFQLDELVD